MRREDFQITAEESIIGRSFHYIDGVEQPGMEYKMECNKNGCFVFGVKYPEVTVKFGSEEQARAALNAIEKGTHYLESRTQPAHHARIRLAGGEERIDYGFPYHDWDNESQSVERYF